MNRLRIFIVFVAGMILILCGPTWARQEISLNGEWDIQYSYSDSYPPEGEWATIAVPSHIKQQEEQYAWYRRDFRIPSSMSGQRVFLKFGGVKFVSEIYVNGESVGGHYGGWEPFEVEITDNCVIGGENQLLVRAMDVSGVIESGVRHVEGAKDSVMAPVGSQPSLFGIWQDVSLESRSDVYIDDVFIRTSVRNGTIEVDFTLTNLSDRDREVVLNGQIYDGTDVQLTLGGTTLHVSPRSAAEVTLREVWTSPKLWSPESPHLYWLVCGLMDNGSQIDETSTRFGFREFWTDGIYFILNGTRVKLLATATHPFENEPWFGPTKEHAKKLYSDIRREANCVAMRLHANLWPETWYEAADEVGMLLIQESALWCFADEYALSDQRFWSNMKDHLYGMVRRDRSHPSVVMYSIENEILHCGGDRVPWTEGKLAELGTFVKSMDPTRPIMYDGDADPMSVADVENIHYAHEFPKWNLWPNDAYWVDKKIRTDLWPRGEWQWERQKPFYMGEFMWSSSQTPDPFTIFVGDDAYLDQEIGRMKSKTISFLR